MVTSRDARAISIALLFFPPLPAAPTLTLLTTQIRASPILKRIFRIIS